MSQKEDPVSYAIAVIKNYEIDIRAAIADGKLPDGFCQGEIYREAVPRIMQLRGAWAEGSGITISLAGAPPGTEISYVGASGERLHVKVRGDEPAVLIPDS